MVMRPYFGAFGCQINLYCVFIPPTYVIATPQPHTLKLLTQTTINMLLK